MDDRSESDRSRTMAAIRSTNTRPERKLRSALHTAGVRFRLGQVVTTENRKVRPDIVFRGARLVVFVDGCFWHGCPSHCRMPSSNTDYWDSKIERNRVRDRLTDDALQRDGWVTIRIWEHEDPDVGAACVARALKERRPGRTSFPDASVGVGDP